jgi:glycosyltransferase involved in cell wall biosynthesis
MAPAPAAIDFVKEKNIPNIHFLPPSGNEKDIWAFHFAQDAMAHFRKDGETQGLNISESMLAAKPIISHKSTVWNAHVEYLANDFSRVAEVDAVDEYAGFMEEFIKLKASGQLAAMGQKAKQAGEQLFLIENNINTFELWLKQVAQ